MRVVPRLGVLVPVPGHADAVVKDRQLDVAVSLLDGGVERAGLVLADVPVALEEVLVVGFPEGGVHPDDDLFVGAALERDL